MLFDLKGKRRRTVQAVYIVLALLMGLGLVGFGIGSDAQGGLFSGCSEQGATTDADKAIKKRIDRAEKTLAKDPKNAPALAELTRGHCQLATSSADPQTSEFTAKSRKDLQAAVDAWQRYLDAVKKPDAGLGRLVIQAYDGLGRQTKDPKDAKPFWEGASEAAEVIAQARPNAQNYIQLVQYATLAGQTRKATLAGKQAIKLAPKGQKKAAKDAVKQAKQAASTQGQPAQGAPAP